MNDPAIHIYQIFYDDKSRAALDPEAIPLDNTLGPPDWYEFWPILKFLRDTNLDDNAFYGFFSPSFADKAGFSVKQIKSIVAKERRRDVVIFSSFWTSLIVDQNPWLQGEHRHPGIIDRAQTFFDSIGLETDLPNLWTDTTTSAFSNYLVAKPKYWRKWLELAEKYYTFVETSDPDGLHQQVTTYRGKTSVAFKVFIQERLCSHVLLLNDFDTIMPSHPFPPGRPMTNPARVRWALERMDNAKRRYRQTGNPVHLLWLKWFNLVRKNAARKGPLHKSIKRWIRRKILRGDARRTQ